jgi:hypothetical protein
MAKKKLTPEDAEAKIRKAAAEGKIVYASSDDVEDYEEIAREFLQKIFKINYDECFISDESSLADFSGCGMPDSEEIEKLTLEQHYALGKVVMVRTINENYGIDVSPNDLLVDVFERIRKHRSTLLN